MIPLSTLVTITSASGTEVTYRFNLFRSVEITGVPGPGYTSGQALATLEDVFKQTMPKEMGFAYASMSYQEKIAPPADRRLSSLSCSYSAARRACMRAGVYRGRFCLALPWSRWARSLASG